MFLRIRIVFVFLCIGMGVAPQSVVAAQPNPMRDLFSNFRWTYKRPVVKNEGQTDRALAVSHHRLARNHAERNDFVRAADHFGLALASATPHQIPGIAVDYAAFLSENGDLHRAELVLRQALLQTPGDSEITKTLARCLVRQNKMVEGLRYFKSVGTEEEAQTEIAAIYREQGNTDMLALVEQRWGTTGAGRQEPAFLATTGSAVPVPIPRLPAPVALPPVVAPASETPVLANPITLAVGTVPQLPRGIEASSLTATHQPRRHYSNERKESLDALFQVQPVAASVPVQ